MFSLKKQVLVSSLILCTTVFVSGCAQSEPTSTSGSSTDVASVPPTTTQTRSPTTNTSGNTSFVAPPGSTTPTGATGAGTNTNTNPTTTNTSTNQTATSPSNTTNTVKNECEMQYVNLPLYRSNAPDLYDDLNKTVSCNFGSYIYLDKKDLELGTYNYPNGTVNSYLSCYSPKNIGNNFGVSEKPTLETSNYWAGASCKPLFEKVRVQAGWYTYCNRSGCYPYYDGDIVLFGQVRCCKNPVQ